MSKSPTSASPETRKQNDNVQNIEESISKIEDKIARMENKPKSNFDKLIAVLTLVVTFILGVGGWYVNISLKKIEDSSKDSQKTLKQDFKVQSEIIIGGQSEFVDRAAEYQYMQSESEQLIREGELLAAYIDPLSSKDPRIRKLAVNAILTAMPESGRLFLDALKKGDQE